MKKKAFLYSIVMMVSSTTFAGGLLTNTNQNVAFLRNPARDAAIGIDGVYSNPAGVVFLPQGFHLSLNFQSAYQTREITSTFGPFKYGFGNNDSSQKKFKGDAKAPVIPSLQAAYNRGNWSYSFNFAIGGGGGKCEFNNGLGSFESQAALLPLLGQSLGIESYSMDSYMRGRQYYYGFQLGAARKINDNLSVFLGGCLIYATCNYYGYVKDIQINNPESGTMTSASEFFSGKYAGYVGLATELEDKAIAAQTIAEQYAAAGDAANAALYTALAQQAAAGAQQAAAGAKTMGTLAVATEDVTLNCDQQGWGFTPIVGIDYKIGRLNLAAKYEFKTKIRLDNRAANSESAERLAMLDRFRDGKTVKEDIPAILTLGAQYEILPSLRISAGYHHYFDKQASQEGETEKNLRHGSREFLAGIEYDINSRIQASAGWQNTHYGLTDAYMKDMSFNVCSNSVGVGLGIQATKRIKVNVAYFQTIYKDYERTTSDYNNVSSTIKMAVGEETANALVQGGALTGSDVFTRTNKVFGVGIDFTF